MVYWRLKSIPELRDLPPEVRKQLWRRANNSPLRLIDVAWLAALFTPMGFMFWLAHRLHLVVNRRWIEIVLFALIVLVYPRYMFMIMALRVRPALRRLREWGPEFVPRTGCMTPTRYLFIMGGVAWMMSLPGLLGTYLDGTHRTSQGILFGFVFLAAGLVCFVFAGRASWLVRRREVRRMNGLCLNCGYDLRGISSEHCPECGQARGAPVGRIE
jgi:hypothetical protein